MKTENTVTLLTLAEAAKLLHCSRAFLYQAIEQGFQLPVVRLGRGIRFNGVELIEFFKSGAYTRERQERVAKAKVAK